jgi:hypothetical protein
VLDRGVVNIGESCTAYVYSLYYALYVRTGLPSGCGLRSIVVTHCTSVVNVGPSGCSPAGAV